MKGASKGLQFNDRELMAQVRTLTLNEIEKILKKGYKGTNRGLYTAVITRLAGTILPRLNELKNQDGTPFVIQITSAGAQKYGIDPSAASNPNG